MNHGVDQAAGKGVAAADPVENVEREELTLEGVPLIPHEGFEAVLAAAVGVPDMPGNALDVGIAADKGLEDIVLLFIAGAVGDIILDVALGGVQLIFPEVIGFDPQQNVHIGQAFRAEVPGFLPAPQGAAEVAVKTDGQSLFPGHPQAVHNQAAAIGTQGGGDAAQMQPGKPVQQGVDIHSGKVKLRDGAVTAVVDHLAGPDAVAGFQIVAAQPVGGGLLRGAEDHWSAVHVIAAQHADGALSQTVVGDHTEKRTVHAQIGQSQGNIGLAAAITGFKAGGHPDLLVVGRGQAQHNFADGNEFAVTFAVQKGISVFHTGSSFHIPGAVGYASLYPAPSNFSIEALAGLHRFPNFDGGR